MWIEICKSLVPFLPFWLPRELSIALQSTGPIFSVRSYLKKKNIYPYLAIVHTSGDGAGPVHVLPSLLSQVFEQASIIKKLC